MLWRAPAIPSSDVNLRGVKTGTPSLYCIRQPEKRNMVHVLWKALWMSCLAPFHESSAALQKQKPGCRSSDRVAVPSLPPACQMTASESRVVSSTA